MRLKIDAAEIRIWLRTWRDAVVLTRSRDGVPTPQTAARADNRLSGAAERVEGCLMLLQACTADRYARCLDCLRIFT
jgi:hypothetical protein